MTMRNQGELNRRNFELPSKNVTELSSLLQSSHCKTHSCNTQTHRYARQTRKSRIPTQFCAKNTLPSTPSLEQVCARCACMKRYLIRHGVTGFSRFVANFAIVGLRVHGWEFLDLAKTIKTVRAANSPGQLMGTATRNSHRRTQTDSKRIRRQDT